MSLDEAWLANKILFLFDHHTAQDGLARCISSLEILWELTGSATNASVLQDNHLLGVCFEIMTSFVRLPRLD